MESKNFLFDEREYPMLKRSSWPIVVFIVILAITALACGVSIDPGGQPDANVVETMVAATLQSITAGEGANPPAEPEAPAQPEQPAQPEEAEPQPNDADEAETVLPAPVYYLSGDAERAQIYRLERDGVTTFQLTAEAGGIDDYDVSDADGTVVYLINNQLYRINPDGSGRALLVDGGPVDENSDDYHYETKLDTPRWSPDGTRIAFYRGGLNIYNVGDGSIQQVLQNQLDVLDNGYTLPQAIYFVGDWSPDGQYLMLNVGWYEGGTVGIYHVANGVYTTADYPGIFCCYQFWTPDSRAVLVASDAIGMIDSGLWRLDAATGVVQTLLESQAADGSYNFAGGPNQMPNGDLRYFYHNNPNIIEGYTSLQLVHSAADAVTGRQVLVGESMVIYEVLWSPEGSLVLVVAQPTPDDQSYPRRGTLKLVNPESGQVRVLLQQANDLRWGR
jgi:Tol biopolymer transport system component